MSVDKALGAIDELLSVIDEADKLAESKSDETPAKLGGGKVIVQKIPTGARTYFKTAEDVTEGQHVRVTDDLKLLTSAWEEAELGPNDELFGYLNVVGEVAEIEDDDDTLQLQWKNYDTCWIPLSACSDAGTDPLTFPTTDNPWLTGAPAEEAGDEKKEDEDEPAKPTRPVIPDGTFYTTAEEVPIGKTVRITSSIEILTAKWKEAELGPHDDLEGFLGQVALVEDAEEDDDTLQLVWKNYDTCWMPAQACFDAEGAPETIPGNVVSWLG
jgi:hypothetical protein